MRSSTSLSPIYIAPTRAITGYHVLHQERFEFCMGIQKDPEIESQTINSKLQHIFDLATTT